jgi:hypothetical protein
MLNISMFKATQLILILGGFYLGIIQVSSFVSFAHYPVSNICKLGNSLLNQKVNENLNTRFKKTCKLTVERDKKSRWITTTTDIHSGVFSLVLIIIGFNLRRLTKNAK